MDALDDGLAPRAVLGNGPAFFLREARHDGQKDFAFTIEGLDVFFFKIDLDTVFLRLPDGGQGINCVPHKAAWRIPLQGCWDCLDFP